LVFQGRQDSHGWCDLINMRDGDLFCLDALPAKLGALWKAHASVHPASKVMSVMFPSRLRCFVQPLTVRIGQHRLSLWRHDVDGHVQVALHRLRKRKALECNRDTLEQPAFLQPLT